MDKEEPAGMIKKYCVAFLLAVFLASLAGCETVKMAFTGGGEGMQRDWDKAKEIDAWMRENLW